MRFLIVGALLMTAAGARADVTYRVLCDIRSPILPADELTRLSRPTPLNPCNAVVTLKGDLALTSFGYFSTLLDLAADRVTLLDGRDERMATLPAKEFMGMMRVLDPHEAPPKAAEEMASKIEFHVETRDAGRGARVRGIETVEKELVGTITFPVPGRAAPVRLEIRQRIWIATPAEVERVPGLREYAAYGDRPNSLHDIGALARVKAGFLPGFPEKLEAELKRLALGGAMLRFRMTVQMPEYVQIMRDAHQAVPPGVSADTPLVEIAFDAQDFNAAEVPAAAMRVPAYRAASAEELIRAMLPPAPHRD